MVELPLDLEGDESIDPSVGLVHGRREGKRSVVPPDIAAEFGRFGSQFGIVLRFARDLLGDY